MQSTGSTTPSTPEKGSSDDLIPLFKSAIAPDGDRSMAYIRCDPGEPTTAAESWEQSMPGPDNLVMRRHVRRMDKAMCWFFFENWRSGRVRSILQFVCLPLLIIRIGASYLRFGWELRQQRRGV